MISFHKKKGIISDEKRVDNILIEASELKKEMVNKQIPMPPEQFICAAKSRFISNSEKDLHMAEKRNSTISKKDIINAANPAISFGPPVTMQNLKEELPEIDGKIKEAKKLFGLKFWDRQKLKKKPDSSYIIQMDYSNGTTRTFVISTRAETFKYRKRTYYLRYEDCKFDLSSNQYKLCYHEDYVLPYSREVYKKPAADGDEWGKALHMVNPDNFKPLLEYEYIRVLAENLLSKYIKLCLLVSILAFLVAVVSMIGIIKMGAFKGK